MKASELRIGNLLKKQCNGPIFAVTSMDIALIDGWAENKEEFLPEPITVSSEWLQMLGFRTFDGTVWGIQIRNYHIQIYFYDCWNLTIESDNEKCELQGYWAVHNFQNIIFEITGEELEWAR